MLGNAISINHLEYLLNVYPTRRDLYSSVYYLIFSDTDAQFGDMSENICRPL